MDDRDVTRAPHTQPTDAAARHDDTAGAARHAARAADDTGAPREERADEAKSAVGAAGAGAVAGTLASFPAGALTAVLTAGLGTVAGAALGAAVGTEMAHQRGSTGFTAEHDAHYRALYDGRAIADRRYDDVRAAYAFGHLAAAEPALADRSFDEVEPELRAAWSDELRTRAGAWDTVRPFVRDAFGHARAEGVGARRDTRVIGSAGSAVDPVELERARRGEPSDGRPLDAADALDADDLPSRDRVELPANVAHRHDPELH